MSKLIEAASEFLSRDTSTKQVFEKVEDDQLFIELLSEKKFNSLSEEDQDLYLEALEKLDEISAELATRARDKAKSSELDNLMKAKSVLDKTKNIPIVSKIGRAMAQPNIDQAERRKRQANLADRKLGGMGQYRYDDKGRYGREGPAKVLATKKAGQ